MIQTLLADTPDDPSRLAAAKAFVWRLLQALPGQDMAAALRQAAAADATWHVSHPLNLLHGPQAVADALYGPLQAAFAGLERRTDIFIGGHWAGTPDTGPGGNPPGGGRGWWCSTTGHYVGIFEAPWLGIPPTGAAAALRFGEFYRVEGSRVVEARVLLDIIDLARQAGIRLLPQAAGQEWLVPGPAPHDGLLLGVTDPAAGAESMRTVMAMIAGLFAFDGQNLQSMAMQRFWHPQMMWYGPGGIGSTRGIAGFQRHHQRPFLEAFPDRRGAGHHARLAEGPFVASTGWPSVLATHAGSYLGVPATQRAIGMRVMDWWRREGAWLTENWVLIDLPHLMLQMGLDVLAPLQQRGGSAALPAAAP